MRVFLLIALLVLSACSKAEDTSLAQCLYTDQMVESLVDQEGDFSLYRANRKQAKEGDERILLEQFTLANGDEVSIEHSYCYMYNYSLTYRLSSVKKVTSLVKILPLVSDLIAKSKAGAYLTRPFSEITLESLSMSQKRLKEAFSVGLPNRFTSSKENVEYSLEYKPLSSENFGAEFKIYVGVGGV